MSNSVNASNPFGGAPGAEAVDAAWVIICTFIIFTMQSGFALLESGSVSRKSEASIMVKNMLDFVVGGFGYWLLGYGFSFGPNTKSSNTMAGESHFVLNGDNFNDGYLFAQFFFQLSFAATATTIVSGAVAERVKFSSYMIFALLNTSFIYVFPAHWMWDSNGWLNKGGALDFAGTCVVHMCGGISALAAAIVVGPRLDRFGKNKEKYYMVSPTNVVLGTFILWWGWIGFNCGSTFAISGDTWMTTSRVAVVTMNGGIGGGLSGIALDLVMQLKRKYFLNIPELVCGALGGLVAITCSANVIRPWEAIVIGFIGGFFANGAVAILYKLKIDDPVGSFGVHYAAGLWGMIATGFFAQGDTAKNSGIFRHGDGTLLGYNLLACVSVTVWCGGLTAIVFTTLHFTLGIRITEDEERLGSDLVEHGIEDIFAYSLEKAGTFGKRVFPPSLIIENGNNDLSKSGLLEDDPKISWTLEVKPPSNENKEADIKT